MAVVDLNTNEYVDVQSGLLQKFGPDKGRARLAGEVSQLESGRHCATVYLNLGNMPTAASGNEMIVDDTVTIPNGAFIEQVDVLVIKEPVTSGSPNLDLGLVDQDRSTEIDFNGLIAAGDAWETGGTDLGTLFTYVKGTTEAGALIGTKLTNTGIITASPDTADWTAGFLQIRIYYSMHPTAVL